MHRRHPRPVRHLDPGPTPPGNPPANEAPDFQPALSHDLPGLAAAWSSLGEVLHLTRHPAATLGQLGRYPGLAVSPHGAWGWTRGRELLLDFSVWAFVSAVGRRMGDGTSTLFDVHSESGIAHRVVLPADVDQDLVQHLVQAHAGAPGQAAGPRSRVPSAPWHARISPRRGWLRRCPPGVRPVHACDLGLLLAAARAARLPVQIAVYTGPVVHRATCRIDILERQKSGRIRVRGRDAFCDIDPAGLPESWLVCSPCGCCGDERWAMECFDGSGSLCLTLQAGSKTDEDRWRNLLSGALPTHVPG